MVIFGLCTQGFLVLLTNVFGLKKFNFSIIKQNYNCKSKAARVSKSRKSLGLCQLKDGQTHANSHKEPILSIVTHRRFIPQIILPPSQIN